MSDLKIDLQALAAQFSNRKLPPVDDWHPAVERTIDMRIDRSGKWYYNGSVIDRDRMVALFSTVLRKDDKDYYLVTPQEKLRIQVDNVPFLAPLMQVTGYGPQQMLEFTDNVGNVFTAGPQNRLWAEQFEDQTMPYVMVRGQLAALLARPVYYQLAELLVEVDDVAGVWSDGVFSRWHDIQPGDWQRQHLRHGVAHFYANLGVSVLRIFAGSLIEY